MWDGDTGRKGRPDPVRLGDLLPGVLRETAGDNLWTEVRVRKAWPGVVGEKVAAYASVDRLRSGVLEVTVTDEVWATEIRYLGSVIVERLNAVLGAGTVREVAVRRARRT